jgi:hypothetical protein
MDAERKPKWRWLLLPLSPVAVPIAFVVTFITEYRRQRRRGTWKMKTAILRADPILFKQIEEGQTYYQIEKKGFEMMQSNPPELVTIVEANKPLCKSKRLERHYIGVKEGIDGYWLEFSRMEADNVRTPYN